MEIKIVELAKEQYKNKCPYDMKPEGITIHETDNNAPAKNEVAYMQRNTNEVSFHFAVDDVEVIQGLPLDRNSWNSGDGENGFGNRKTISIEICKNYKVDNLEAYYKGREKTEQLVGYLLHKYGWTDKNIYTHNDHNGKGCPRVILKEGYLATFKKNAMLEKAKLEPVKPIPKPIPVPKPKPVAPQIVKEVGNEFVLGHDVYERNNPSLSDKSGLKLRKKGERIEYNAYTITDNHNWVRQLNGKWLPWRETNGDKFGTIETKQVKNKPSGVWTSEKGTFILSEGVYERNEPTTSDRAGLRLLGAGVRVPYDAYLIQGGYVWLRRSDTGKVLPWRVHNGETWGKVV